MSRCFCKYFAFCLYSVILFSSANSGTLAKVLNYEENQDYTSFVLDTTTESVLGTENLEIKTTPEPDSEISNKLEQVTVTTAEIGIETTTSAAVQSEKDIIEDAVKDSNMTVLIIGILFAMTMIVKGAPVIIAYAIPYFTNNPITNPGDFEDKHKQKADESDDISSIENEHQEEKDQEDLKEIKIISGNEIVVNLRLNEIIPEIHSSSLKNAEKTI